MAGRTWSSTPKQIEDKNNTTKNKDKIFTVKLNSRTSWLSVPPETNTMATQKNSVSGLDFVQQFAQAENMEAAQMRAKMAQLRAEMEMLRTETATFSNKISPYACQCRRCLQLRAEWSSELTEEELAEVDKEEERRFAEEAAEASAEAAEAKLKEDSKKSV